MEELAYRYGIWILLALMVAAYVFSGSYRHSGNTGNSGHENHGRPRKA